MELGYRQPAYVMQASNGFLFMTSYPGGDYGYGMILRMNSDGSDPVVVHSFSGYDGVFAYSALTEASDGMLYGVAHLGGAYGYGVVYRIDANGNGFQVVHNFTGADGALPNGALTQAPDGTLYGVNGITLYKMNPDGSNFQALQYFDLDTGQGGGCDLLMYEHNLYGVTIEGGLPIEFREAKWWGGTVYKIDLETETFRKIVNLNRIKGTQPYFGGLVVMNPPQPVQGVQNYSMVDARTEEKITDFDESVTLDVGDPDFRHWTIRANTYPDEVGSVVFKIDVQKKNIENKAPYLLAGHHFRRLSPTPHILEAEAYSERLGRGNRLQSRAALIRYINNTTVNSLTVLDAEGETVQELNDGDVINAGDPLLRNFNIEAWLNRDSNKGSVQFYINGEPFWTENRAPYIMVTGNRKWWSTPGLYTVTAIPYSARNGEGLAGVPHTVTFTISDTNNDNPAIARMANDSLTTTARKEGMISVYPVPAQNVLHLLPDAAFGEQDVMVTIHDAYGETRFKKFIRLTSQPHVLKLTEMGLNNGMYYLQLRLEDKTQMIRFIKE